MSDEDTATWIVVIILVMIFLLPIGWIFLAYPAEPHYVVTGEPVREAAGATGITVISASNSTWPLVGAEGGMIYILGDDAGNTLAVQTQRFDSAESRDAAILTISTQTIGKGKTAGTLIVIGDQVIHFGPDPGGIISRVATELREKRVPR
jgi:hypothetical protein